MSSAGPRVARAAWPSGRVLVGMPVLDEYLDFAGGRARPNTVLAIAYDLCVSFRAVGKAPAEVTSADVFAFITAQRAGGGQGGRLRTHRDRAVVAAMVLGGLRRCEVLGLRLGDVRTAQRRVFIAEGKSRPSAADPSLGLVLHRTRCLPRYRTANPLRAPTGSL